MFAGLGVYIRIVNGQIWEWRQRYDDKCGSSLSCDFTFDVSSEVASKIHVYYEIMYRAFTQRLLPEPQEVLRVQKQRPTAGQ